MLLDGKRFQRFERNPPETKETNDSRCKWLYLGVSKYRGTPNGCFILLFLFFFCCLAFEFFLVSVSGHLSFHGLSKDCQSTWVEIAKY